MPPLPPPPTAQGAKMAVPFRAPQAPPKPLVPSCYASFSQSLASAVASAATEKALQVRGHCHSLSSSAGVAVHPPHHPCTASPHPILPISIGGDVLHHPRAPLLRSPPCFNPSLPFHCCHRQAERERVRENLTKLYHEGIAATLASKQNKQQQRHLRALGGGGAGGATGGGVGATRLLPAAATSVAAGLLPPSSLSSPGVVVAAAAEQKPAQQWILPPVSPQPLPPPPPQHGAQQRVAGEDQAQWKESQKSSTAPLDGSPSRATTTESSTFSRLMEGLQQHQRGELQKSIASATTSALVLPLAGGSRSSSLNRRSLGSVSGLGSGQGQGQVRAQGGRGAGFSSALLRGRNNMPGRGRVPLAPYAPRQLIGSPPVKAVWMDLVCLPHPAPPRPAPTWCYCAQLP